jgi:hypothetical protein
LQRDAELIVRCDCLLVQRLEQFTEVPSVEASSNYGVFVPNTRGQRGNALLVRKSLPPRRARCSRLGLWLQMLLLMLLLLPKLYRGLHALILLSSSAVPSTTVVHGDHEEIVPKVLW